MKTKPTKQLMKILVTGIRGIPHIGGGIETHCQQLYPRLCKIGYDITIVNRKHYCSKTIKHYKGVHICQITTPHIKGFEALMHTLLSVFYARLKCFKYIHIHAIGPSLAVPLAKMLGLKVIVTNHGPDYKRKKWGIFSKCILKLGEYWGTKFADKIIVVSPYIKHLLQNKYKRSDIQVIYNGITKPKKSKNKQYLYNLGLKEKSYILAVGRFVPEKGFGDLINAFSHLENMNIQLVLVGDTHHKSRYSMELMQKARAKGCILTGFIRGDRLNQIYTNARLFVLPSYHEGMPISLLEAMSYNLDVLASDIQANKEIKLPPDCYFKCGNIKDLKDNILKKLQSKVLIHNDIIKKFNWQTIAQKTAGVYDSIYKNY